MKEQLTPLQIAIYAVNCPIDNKAYTDEVAGMIKDFADQEKQALKEKIKRELLTEWTWSDVALMGDVLKKIERLLNAETLK